MTRRPSSFAMPAADAIAATVTATEPEHATPVPIVGRSGRLDRSLPSRH